MKIKVSEEFKSKIEGFVGAALIVEAQNTKHNETLWAEIDQFSENLRSSSDLTNIKTNIPIASTRHAYKLLGKDPNRYRPSAEALRRRILRDLPLFQIDTMVDLINLVSLETGYSISGLDLAKIDGKNIILGVGKANEYFEAIGRGVLNIEGLPVYRDNLGGISTPTSDEERTKLTTETSQLLILINAYDRGDRLDFAINYAKELLHAHLTPKSMEIVHYS